MSLIGIKLITLRPVYYALYATTASIHMYEYIIGKDNDSVSITTTRVMCVNFIHDQVHIPGQIAKRNIK